MNVTMSLPLHKCVPAFHPCQSCSPPTCIAQWGIFVQGKQRRVQQDSVVILHDDALVLSFDPWLVLVC